MTEQSLALAVGELVEVRPLGEILSTLNKQARLDELPFMPQMIQCCGKQFRVRKRAHKLCDTAFGTGARRLDNAVYLDGLQCDGEAYGGCEMRCHIVWKEAWLKRVEPNARATSSTAAASQAGCSEADIWAAAKSRDADGDIFVCQATQMVEATKSLSPWSPGQYVEDYKSGNVPLSRILSGILFFVYSKLVVSGVGFGSALRWAYDAVQKIRGGVPFPERPGLLPKGGPTPAVKLGLEVGDLVRIRSHDEILQTVDENLMNRGMGFHPEMVPYCGKTFRVRQRVRKIINERTGRLVELKNSCLVLDGADCIGRYSRPLNCPRASNPYWREIWLERVNAANGSVKPAAKST
jgi:hypothetical protein